MPVRVELTDARKLVGPSTCAHESAFARAETAVEERAEDSRRVALPAWSVPASSDVGGLVGVEGLPSGEDASGVADEGGVGRALDDGGTVLGLSEKGVDRESRQDGESEHRAGRGGRSREPCGGGGRARRFELSGVQLVTRGG